MAAGAVPAAAVRPPQNLDELMLAMDVVDTIRHQDALVGRELDEDRREADLLERLRQLYRGQGIEVPDRVLREGVRALKESRFVYAPPAPSLARTLAHLWVNRARTGRALVAILALLVVGGGAYYGTVVVPGRERAQAERVEAERREAALRERLPRALDAGHAEVIREAQVDEARQRADRLLADGRAAVARRDVAGAETAIGDLETLRADLRREYVLRIVSRPGEPTGVWRTPPGNPNGRNYYAIVEPVAPDGRVLTLPVTSEEDGRRAEAARFGVRVSPATFNQIRRDKEDDGIVQQNILGRKARGRLAVDYAMPALGGTILQW